MLVGDRPIYFVTKWGLLDSGTAGGVDVVLSSYATNISLDYVSVNQKNYFKIFSKKN